MTRPKYKEACYLLLKYWDCLPDDEKEAIHKKLLELGV